MLLPIAVELELLVQLGVLLHAGRQLVLGGGVPTIFELDNCKGNVWLAAGAVPFGAVAFTASARGGVMN